MPDEPAAVEVSLTKLLRSARLGGLKRVGLPLSKDGTTGFSNGIAFCEFKSEEKACTAASHLNGLRFESSILTARIVGTAKQTAITTPNTAPSTPLPENWEACQNELVALAKAMERVVATEPEFTQSPRPMAVEAQEERDERLSVASVSSTVASAAPTALYSPVQDVKTPCAYCKCLGHIARDPMTREVCCQKLRRKLSDEAGARMERALDRKMGRSFKRHEAEVTGWHTK